MSEIKLTDLPQTELIPDEVVEQALAAWIAKLSELPDFDTPGLTLSERIRRQHKAGIRAALEAAYLRMRVLSNA